MSEALAVAVPRRSLITEIMMDSGAGASVFAMAETFASSQLVPKHLQGKPSDCFIALTIAAELRQNPLMVMQNIVIVQGTAGWKAQYSIAMANASGLFKDRIDWVVERPGGHTAYKRKTRDGVFDAKMENMKVTAFATLAGTGARVEFSVDTAMAIAEGWADNTKYISMPEVMLRYRSGAFLVRFYAPDVMFGMQAAEELETLQVSEPGDVQIIPAPKGRAALGPAKEEPRRIVEQLPPQTTEPAPEPTTVKPEPTKADPNSDEDP